MSRGFGEVEVIQELLPEGLAVGIAAITQLGSIWFLALLLAMVYWFGIPNRQDIAALGGVWVAGLGCYKGLKQVFGSPRPEEPLLETTVLPWAIQPLYDATVFVGGYGFPSGHAISSTIVYVGLATVLPWGTPRKRFTVAALVVATVALSRVALGVHYLVDVVVGIALGLVFLGVLRVVLTSEVVDSGTIAFTLGIGFSLFYVVASDAYLHAVIVLGASLGAFAGWQLVTAEAVRPHHGPAVVRGSLASVALLPVAAALAFAPFSLALAAGGLVGFGAAVVVAAPVFSWGG